MNVGLINGGSAKNSVPASCSISIDFRIAKSTQLSMIIKKIEKLAQKYPADVKIIEKIEPFYDEITFLEPTKTANFITEASMMKECKQRIILGTGPVTAHEVNEHISVESYRKLVKQYQELILKVCGG